MPNHVHLILVPSDEGGLRMALAEAHRRYSRRGAARRGASSRRVSRVIAPSPPFVTVAINEY